MLGSCSESVTRSDGGDDMDSATTDSGSADATVFPFDGPVANLIAPPEDSGTDSTVAFPFDGPVANLVAPPPDAAGD